MKLTDKQKAAVAMNKQNLAGQLAAQSLPAAIQATLSRVPEDGLILSGTVVDFVWDASLDLADRIIENQLTIEQVHGKALGIGEPQAPGILIPHPNSIDPRKG